MFSPQISDDKIETETFDLSLSFCTRLWYPLSSMRTYINRGHILLYSASRALALAIIVQCGCKSKSRSYSRNSGRAPLAHLRWILVSNEKGSLSVSDAPTALLKTVRKWTQGWSNLRIFALSLVPLSGLNRSCCISSMESPLHATLFQQIRIWRMCRASAQALSLHLLFS